MRNKISIIIVFVSLIGGCLVTYVTGFFRPLLPERTVDVLLWGSPLPYLSRVVTFHGPPFINWVTASADFIFWAIVIGIILSVAWLLMIPAGEDGRQSNAD